MVIIIFSRAMSFCVLSFTSASCSGTSERSKSSLVARRSLTKLRSSANCEDSASLICSQWCSRCAGHVVQLLHNGTWNTIEAKQGELQQQKLCNTNCLLITTYSKIVARNVKWVLNFKQPIWLLVS